MQRELSDCSEPVRRLVGQIGLGRGKMLRPGLLLLSAMAFGKSTAQHIRAAAVVEIIHNATLLHDDVVDEGKSRRGVPTINALQGNEPAVLFGDFLLSRVFAMCLKMGAPAAEIIARATSQTCEGELKQISQRGNWKLSESEYIGIIAEKTASFFSAACVLGAKQSGAGEKQVRALAQYGHKTGIAFQITDDLLDLVGDHVKTGKSVGNDLDKNKLTLPMINFLEVADKKDKELAKRVLCGNGDKSALTRRDRAVLLTKLRKNGCLSYAQRRAQEFADQAIEAISGLKRNKGTRGLIDIARFVVERTA